MPISQTNFSISRDKKNPKSIYLKRTSAKLLQNYLNNALKAFSEANKIPLKKQVVNVCVSTKLNIPNELKRT